MKEFKITKQISFQVFLRINGNNLFLLQKVNFYRRTSVTRADSGFSQAYILIILMPDTTSFMMRIRPSVRTDVLLLNEIHKKLFRLENVSTRKRLKMRLWCFQECAPVRFQHVLLWLIIMQRQLIKQPN